MAIFPDVELEKVVQVADKTRLDASKTFITQDEAAVTLVEIEPEDAAGFIIVTPSPATKTENYFLDWAYATEGTKTVSVRVTTDGSPTTSTGTISVLTAADDRLFSGDADIYEHETDLRRYVPRGKNSFLFQHRRAQDLIIAYLDEQGFVNVFDTKFDKNDIDDLEEVRQWSTFLALELICENQSNAIDDIWAEKAAKYHSETLIHRRRAVLRIDVDGDGVTDTFEDIGFTFGRAYRR